jgi:outer membrane protein OmpA-like peptidoglycan-associated protein
MLHERFVATFLKYALRQAQGEIISRPHKELFQYALRQAQGEVVSRPHAEPATEHIEASWKFLRLVCATSLLACMVMANMLHAQESSAQTISPPSSPPSSPQDTVRPSATRYGVYLHGLNALHVARFAKFAGVPSCCPDNLKPAGLNLGWEAGALGEWPFATSVGIALRLGFGAYNGAFSTDEQTVFGFDKADAIIRHSLTTSIYAASASPLLFFRPFERLTLYAGGTAAVAVATRFSQTERFVAPDTAIFASTKSRERNLVSGAIPQFARFLPSFAAGVSYELPLNRMGTTLLALEAFYSFGLINLADGLTARTGGISSAGAWAMHSLRAGASLRFAPERTSRMTTDELESLAAILAAKRRALAMETEPSSSTQARTDTLNHVKPANVRPAATAAARITAIKGVMPDGSETDMSDFKRLRVEEFMASQSRYILPMVFFDERSAVLPDRYRRLKPADKAAFSPTNLAALSTLDTYAHVLNILGSRMNASPQAKLILTGYADVASERSSKQLAEQRAQAVRAYLMEVWKIDGKRVTIQTAQHKLSAASADPLEREEQRRVELSTTTPALLDEMRFDYTLRVFTPPVLRVQARIDAARKEDKGVKSDNVEGDSVAHKPRWVLQARQTQHVGQMERTSSEGASRLVWTADANANASADASVLSTEWNVSASPSDSLPQGSQPLMFSIYPVGSSLDNDTQQTKTNADNTAPPPQAEIVRLPVEHITVEDKRRANAPDERVDVYSVFAFHYNTDEFSVQDVAVQRLVRVIRTTLKAGAHVSITGYTDVRGAEQVNKRLSEDRAQAVARLLNFPGAQVQGLGSAMPPEQTSRAATTSATTTPETTTPESRFYRRFVRVEVRTPVR